MIRCFSIQPGLWKNFPMAAQLSDNPFRFNNVYVLLFRIFYFIGGTSIFSHLNSRLKEKYFSVGESRQP